MIELKLDITRTAGNVLLEAVQRYRQLQIKKLDTLKKYIPCDSRPQKTDKIFDERINKLSYKLGNVSYHDIERGKRIEYLLKKDIKKRTHAMIFIKRAFERSDIDFLIKILDVNVSLYRGKWERLAAVYDGEDPSGAEHELEVLKSLYFHRENNVHIGNHDISRKSVILKELHDELAYRLWEITPNHEPYVLASFEPMHVTSDGRNISCSMMVRPEKKYMKEYRNELSEEVGCFYDKMANFPIRDFFKDIQDLEETILKAMLMNDTKGLSMKDKEKISEIYDKHTCNGYLEGNIARFFYQFSKLSYYAKRFIILDIRHFIKEVVLK